MRRLYVLIPDLETCRALVNELQAAGIPQRHLHVIGSIAYDLGDLPIATALQKSDVAAGIERGVLLGATAGLIAAFLVQRFPAAINLTGAQVSWLYAGLALLGALFGASVLALIATGIPNHKLRGVRRAIERGELLLMADVPRHQASVIRDAIERHHPEARIGVARPPGRSESK
jgi:hypothetical protein